VLFLHSFKNLYFLTQSIEDVLENGEFLHQRGGMGVDVDVGGSMLVGSLGVAVAVGSLTLSLSSLSLLFSSFPSMPQKITSQKDRNGNCPIYGNALVSFSPLCIFRNCNRNLLIVV
jgi:hypothetical protein